MQLTASLLFRFNLCYFQFYQFSEQYVISHNRNEILGNIKYYKTNKLNRAQTQLNVLKYQTEALNEFKVTNPEARSSEEFPKSLHTTIRIVTLRDELLKLQDELNNTSLTDANKKKCKTS
jgi:hypothetical protein